MSTIDFLKEIKQLRKSGKTLQEIGQQFDVSSERIRQVLNPEERFKCKKHLQFYTKFCSYCLVEKNYKKVIDKVIFNHLETEIERLSKQDRNKEMVIQRMMLVKKLKDDLGISFRKIGFLLKRDHTSITNLYRKKI